MKTDIDWIAANFTERVTASWLLEFGYGTWESEARSSISKALAERGRLRLARELDAHARRLAHHAQMSHVPVGRSGVIR